MGDAVPGRGKRATSSGFIPTFRLSRKPHFLQLPCWTALQFLLELQDIQAPKSALSVRENRRSRCHGKMNSVDPYFPSSFDASIVLGVALWEQVFRFSKFLNCPSFPDRECTSMYSKPEYPRSNYIKRLRTLGYPPLSDAAAAVNSVLASTRSCTSVFKPRR